MRYFLAKSEPKVYSIDRFEKDGQTTWDGVKNPTAVMFLKQMKAGDRVFFYHSGGESQIVGLAQVVGSSRADPKEKRSWLVDFKFLKKFAIPVTLKEIKESGKFADTRLVRQGRLSTMDVPEKLVTYLTSTKKLNLSL
jgi:predicted RNA-binding protein with PUA-like domain